MSSQQMIVTMTAEDLAAIVENASEKGALRALEKIEQKKEQSSILNKEFLTFKDVGTLFCISRATVVRWVEQGKLIKKSINGSPRFETKDVRKILNNY